MYIYIYIYILLGTNVPNDTHTFTLQIRIVKLVHEDYTVLTPKQLGEASLQLLATCVLSTFVGIQIPAKYKVTESMMWLVIIYLLVRRYCNPSILC